MSTMGVLIACVAIAYHFHPAAYGLYMPHALCCRTAQVAEQSRTPRPHLVTPEDAINLVTR